MPRENAPQALMASVLDRLIDTDATGAAFRHGYSVEQIVSSVRRDLESLLNTHMMYVELLDQTGVAADRADWPECRKSLLTYGLPDLATFSGAKESREEIARRIEQAILFFEPRLKNVQARVVEGQDKSSRTVQFTIDAQLNVDPAPEVTFQTVLELTTGHAEVK